jgi:stage II sporulation protein D
VVDYAGQPATTYFFASSGGYTENVEDAWPGATPDAWLRGVPDPYDGAGGDPYHHWTRRLSLAAAARRLGRLVQGKLVGIEVTEHGASPRIMSANVIGTRGATTVAGSRLQGAFGLLSTWAQFTTISSTSAPTPTAAAGDTSGDLAVLAQMKRVFGQMANASQTIHGTILPARKGARVLVEIRAGEHWRKTSVVRLGPGGAYATRVTGAGIYRVIYRGLDGPSVVVP